MDKKLIHICEVCGKTETLTPEEAFNEGWDYPPRMGGFGIVGPRTCGVCPINLTVWWALVSEKVRIKRIIEPRTQFVRYETPLCTYCFSYSALSIIYMIMNNTGIKYGWVIAFVTYILIYFLGMYRRYEKKRELYLCS